MLPKLTHLAWAVALSLSLAPAAARAQGIVTPSPDPAHEILTAPFQADTDAQSHSRLTSGNRFELLENGVVSFPRKHALISTATSQIMVMTMQWNNDATGKAYADELILAAARGVEVRAVVDGALANFSIVNRLRAGGVRVARYNPWFLGIGGRTGRMHEKVLCVDHARAIVGGMNVADGYANGNGSNGDYHDADMYVEGFAAAEVARRFLELYTAIDRRDAAAAALLAGIGAHAQQPAAAAPGRDGYGRVIFNEPDIGRHYITSYYARAIRAARRHVAWHVNNPQPADPILAELKAAGARGVRVVVLTNSKAAFKARNGSFAGFWQWWWLKTFDWPDLRGPGIELWEMDTPIHSKAMTVDGVMASVGSYNLGRSSIQKNTEQTVVTHDPAAIRAVEEMFDRDLAKARRVQ